MSAPFPSAKAASDCLEGVPGGCLRSAGWVAQRSLLLAAGMALAGERQNLPRKVLTASLAVQAVVMTDTWLRDPAHRGQVLSSMAALSGSPVGIVATWLGRASIVWLALKATGQGKNAWRNALAGTAAIEAVVLAWAAKANQAVASAGRP